jgi:hypothetical protein
MFRPPQPEHMARRSEFPYSPLRVCGARMLHTPFTNGVSFFINGTSFKADCGPSFSPEELVNLAAAFEDALGKLRLIDTKDPMATTVAKLVLQVAKDGERDPKKLCNRALKILRK